MTTKIISMSSLMDDIEITGSLDNPEIFPLTHGEIYHAAIADHGDFAVFEYSGQNRFGLIPQTRFKSIVINEEKPILDLSKLKDTDDIYVDSSFQQFEFMRSSQKERG